MKVFGFDIPTFLSSKDEKKKKAQDINSGAATDHSPAKESTTTAFSQGYSEDGAADISANAAGFVTHNMDLRCAARTVKELITQYRNASMLPECDRAISEIVSSAIISGKNNPVAIDLSDIDDSTLSKATKKQITAEFESICSLLDFKTNAHKYFRRWYIDGRLYFNVVVDTEATKDGIKRVIQLDPSSINKVREIEKVKNKKTGIESTRVKAEYFHYQPDNHGMSYTGTQQLLKIHPDAVVYVPSGLTVAASQHNDNVVISYLHKSLKIINQLRMMEDALVIYRITRAPERRVFYIDTGNLSKTKAEEYIQGLMARHRNQLVYDVNTGKIANQGETMGMLQDYWLPRREGGRGTEIDTLPGGDNLGSIDDVLFFQKKMYRSLGVPLARLDSEATYTWGDATDITREEVKFQRYIDRLRVDFSVLLRDLLRVQCILRGICTSEEWDSIVQDINFDFIEDSAFTEMKRFEILKARLDVMDSIDSYVGKYYSEDWVRKNVLNLTDEEIEEIGKANEKNSDNNDDDDDDY